MMVRHANTMPDLSFIPSPPESQKEARTCGDGKQVRGENADDKTERANFPVQTTQEYWNFCRGVSTGQGCDVIVGSQNA